MPYDFDRLTNGKVEEDDIEIETGFGSSIYSTLAEAFHSIYYIIFSGREWTSRFEDRLAAANMSTTADLWISGAFAIGCIVGGSVAVLTMFLALVGVLPVLYPTFDLQFLPAPEVAETIVTGVGIVLGILLYTGIAAFIGVIAGGGVAITIPYMKARQRDRQIGLVQSDAVSFMHALAVSGMSSMEIFKAVGESGSVYGEFSVEFKRIVAQVEHRNTDFRTAVQNVANTTPNDGLRKFLVGMLSTLGAGGDIIIHLETAKDRQRASHERQLETVTDYIRMLGEAYTVMMLAPMLLVIILIIMAVTGQPRMDLLFVTIYGVLPLINIAYGFLVSSVKIDEVGDGYLRAEDGSIPGRRGDNPFDLETVEEYLDQDPVFGQIYQKEAESRLFNYIVNNPLSFFIEYPKYLFAITVPITLIGWVVLYTLGLFTLTSEAITTEPLQQTVTWFYWPLFANLLPFAIFYEYREKKRTGILDTLAEDFRNLAEINDTGLPLTESMREVAGTGQSKLAEEFGIMYKKLQMGKPMQLSLLEFNNKYHIPRLARQLKILEQAQKVSTHIGDVLTTAAETAEYQSRLMEKRAAKMTIQLVIIEGAFIVFLLIMGGMDVALLNFASDIIGSEGGNAIADGGSINPVLLKMAFIHAALFQGFFSGLLGGYVKNNDLGRGVKYALFNITLVLIVWVTVPYIEPFIQ